MSSHDIARELHSLPNLHFTPYNNQDAAQAWQAWFPGVSPRKFYNSLASSFPEAPPQITISFSDPDPKTGTAQMEIMPSNMDYYTKIDVQQGKFKIADYTVKRTGQGNATHMLKWLADIGHATGRKKIEIFACFNNGAYTWARFGFAPDALNWDILKSNIRRYRMNNKQDGFSLRNARHHLGIPYKGFCPAFGFTEDEKTVIDAALKSNEPDKIWRLADLGREVAHIDASKHHPRQSITVGKALLCGLSWSGSLDLDNAEMNKRFSAYVTRAEIFQDKAKQHAKG